MSKSSKSSTEDLSEIYEAYPRHIARRDALRAIEKAIQRLKAGEYKGQRLSQNQAIAGLKNRALMFRDSVAGHRGQFTPHPATWFNRSSYLDDPKEWNELEDQYVPKTAAQLRDERSARNIERAFSEIGNSSDLSEDFPKRTQ